MTSRRAMRSAARGSSVQRSCLTTRRVRAGEIALEVYALLGCSGFSRVDLMLEEATGELYVLEANSIPGLTETSLLAAGG